MRIAYITQSYPPMMSGAAIVAQQLATHMSRRGHQISVITASEKKVAYTLLDDNVRITRFKSFANPTRKGQFVSFWPYPEIRKELSDFKPDLLHFHDPILSGLSTIVLKRELSMPCIVTLHQLPWSVTTFFHPLFSNLIEASLWKYGSWAIKRSAKVLTPNQAIADIVRQRTNIQPDVIGNGVDLTIFNPSTMNDSKRRLLRKQYAMHPDWPIIIYVGRLDADKNVDRIIQATAKVLSSSNVQLLIIGNGKKRNELTELCKSLAISNKTHFLGNIVDKRALADLYQLSSMFVTASEIEVHSLSILEAEASALPVVSVRSPGVANQIVDGESGYLIPPEDTDLFASRIQTLIENPGMAKRMGEKGRELVQRYSLSSFIDSHEKYYRKLFPESD